MERKLAAIFSADVKGYSHLMGDDEIATVRTLTAYREVMTTLIHTHHGRVVDSPGDNLLAEFVSVVDAVQCATEIQHELTVRNAELPTHRQMMFRIGINVGDVLTEDGRLYGDGVNIAARLEGLADAGGICISEAAYTQVKNKVPLGYEYIGEQPVKNIAEPVRVYRVRMESADTAGHKVPSPPVGEGQGERAAREAGSSQFKVHSSQSRRVRPVHQIGAGLVLLIAIVAAVRYLSFPTPNPQSPAPSTQPPLSTHHSSLVTEEAKPPSLPLPDKPSIAILPFANISNDPSQDYFSDGITEDLTSDLSKISSLFVIARNSAFTYKGKAVKVQDVSMELGVRYVLEGSVRKADKQVRITAQLIDATTGGHLWSGRYDRPLRDIFALQDEIVQKIVTTLKLQFTLRGEGIVPRSSTNNLEAYDYFLRGMQFWHRDNPQSRQMYEKAIALDPQYADAYAGLGHTYWLEWLLQWGQNPQPLEQAFTLAQKAIVLDDSQPWGRMLLALVYMWKKQYEPAIAEAQRAVALDPNYADSYWDLALVLTFAGRPEEAIEVIEKAMRLNPHTPVYYFNILGLAFLSAGRYEEAIAALKKGLSTNPNYLYVHLNLAAAYSQSGREEEARAEAAEVLRIDPTCSLEGVRRISTGKDQAVSERYLAALRKAGLK